MLGNLKEVYIPVMIFSIILEYQLAIYFMYLYSKYRKEKIGLNKILLIFSNICGFGATSYLFLVIGSFYLEDVVLAEIFIYIGVVIMLGGILDVLLILLSKPFHTLINLRLVKILSTLIGVSIITLIFFYGVILSLLLSIMIGLIGGIYFLFFQVKLVNLTSGTVHSRLLITLIGENIFFSGTFFGLILPSIFIPGDLNAIFYLIGGYVVTVGLFVILYGTFKFPGVLEFNWKNNLLKLYIIDARNLFELYSYDFNVSRDLAVEPDSYINIETKNSINSIGVVGISDVFDEITKTHQNRVKTIKYGNFTILLEYEEDPKSQFLFVLFVDKNMKSLQSFLKKVKNQFLISYKGLLNNYNIVDRFRETIFSGFDLVLQKILD